MVTRQLQETEDFAPSASTWWTGWSIRVVYLWPIVCIMWKYDFTRNR